MSGLSVSNLTRRKTPAVPFARSLRTTLPHFDVSLAFVKSERARALNQKFRKKSYVPNVLSYATDKLQGEVIICLSEAARQAPSYGMSYVVFVGYLFIHACLH